MPSPPSVLTRVPRHPRAIERPRLLALLDDPRPGLVLVGGPGWGKTVLAAQLGVAFGARVLWCRLSPGHTGARALAEMAHRGTAADVSTESTDPLGLADEVLGLLEDERSLLVVDDYQHAEHAETDTLLAELFPLIPETSRIVVASRTRPAGLVGKGGGDHTRVVDRELAFEADEARALFSAADLDAGRAAEWVAHYAGWPAALGAAVEGGLADDPTWALESLVDRLLDDSQQTPLADAITAAAVLPYLTPDLAEVVGLRHDSLDSLSQSFLISRTGDQLHLDASISEAVLARTSADVRRDLMERAIDSLTDSDPGAAIDLLLQQGDHERAADVLAANLSRLGVERALVWLYEFPAELRRRFPPVVAAGRATVNLDVAAAEAARRVEQAETEPERRESLLGLGSTLAASGDLSGAAEALEGAVAAGIGDESLLRAARTVLARVRWWLGDDAGARAALGATDDSVATRWLDAQVALSDGDLAAAAAHGAAAVDLAAHDADATRAPGLSATVQAALLASPDRPSADVVSSAEEAYRAGLDVGGHDLALGAAAQSWCLIRLGDFERAATVCDSLERRVGRQDSHARLQAAVVRVAIARAEPESHDLEREERRLRDARRPGFAAVEAIARRALPQLTADQPGLRVELLGAGTVLVNGVEIADAAWKSKKALEVLRYLADAGPSGARREEVIEAVWPEREPEKGRTLLRTALSGIRRTIEPGRTAGEPSRFVETSGERVAVAADTDLAEATRLIEAGRHVDAFEILRRRPKPLDGAGSWAADLERSIQRARIETAERIAAGVQSNVANEVDDPGGTAQTAALEVLIEAEPWNRDHVDALMAAHRATGDEAAARAVERRWFEDDDQA